MRARLRRSFLRLLRLGVGGVVAIAGAFAYLALTAADVARNPVEFSIASGSTLRSVAFQLSAAGIVREPWTFIVLGRFTGKAVSIKAGNYELSQNASPWALLGIVTSGEYRLDEISLIEGWTFRQVRQALNAHAALKHDSLAMTDADVLRAVGATESHPEGMFFPDTYLFSRNTSDLDVLRRAYAGMQQHVRTLWETRAPDLPVASAYQALILASIVEKETGKADDRKLIAGVLSNRLRTGMRLQADPTVIYGLGESFDGNLTRRDLAADGPYNTYTRAGLPPTPIAMPGLASLDAALHPQPTSALYYVAKGDGSSHFSDSLAEHNRAVTKYQKLQANPR